MGIKLPEYQQGQRSQGLPSNGFSTQATPEAFGAGIGRGIGDVANVMAEQVKRDKDAADTTAVMEADRKLADWEISKVYGDDGALRKKGRDTLGLPKQLSDDFDAFTGEVAGSLANDTQRQAFAKLSASRRPSLQRTLYSHAAQEMDGFYDQETKGYLDTSRNAAALNYNNPQRVQAEIERGSRALLADSVRKGLAPEATKAALQQYASTVHKDVALRMMDADPLAAKQYMDKNIDSFDAGDLIQLQRTLDPAVTRAQGQRAGDAIYQGGQAPAQAGGALFAAVIGAESNGQQLGKDGKPLTSPKGAVGIAQVMPDTAPESARLAGLPWDEQRYKTDAAYNQQLGAAYFGKLQKDFGGNPVLAVAAYNAGPGMVADWINGTNKTGKNGSGLKIGDPRKGEITSEEFARRIPFAETRNYVAKVVAAAGGAGGERSLTGMLAQADKIQDPEQRRIAQAQIRERYQLDKATREEQYQQNLISAQDVAFSKPGGWRDIPASNWAALKPEDRSKLVQGAPKSSDPDTLLYLQNNPTMWQSGQIERYRPLLSESDYRTFYNKGNGTGAPDKIRAATIDSDQFRNALTQSGLTNLLNAKKGSDDQATLIDLRAKFEQVIDAEQTNKKRALTLDEKNALLTQLIKPVKVRMVRSGTLFGWGDGEATPEERRAFQVKNPRNIVIPPEARAKISADMKARGITPTNDRVLTAYLSMNEDQ